MKIFLSFIFMVVASAAHATTYYVSPSGSNSNNGLTAGAPFLTFSYAINASRAWCGDTLILLDGTYGDGTSTGKITISGINCSVGDVLEIRGLNQRKAKIVDNGSSRAVYITASAHIIIDGIYAQSANNTASSSGYPFFVSSSHHITIRNTVANNPNKASNSYPFSLQDTEDVLLEANEGLDFHRHCILAWDSRRVVVRQQYCHPRDGADPAIFPAGPDPIPAGEAGALLSMYPCTDCILENSIADGRMFLAEMNATYSTNALTNTPVLMSGSKILGSICQCPKGNGIYLSSRKIAALTHTPQNILIKDVAIHAYESPSSVIRVSDPYNVTIDHVTGIGLDGPAGQHGIRFDDSPTGATPAQQSFTVTNSTISNINANGFYRVTSGPTWSGNNLNSYNNGTAFNPSLPSNWGTTSTTNPGFGTCKGVWVPDSSPLKGAGTGGSDIGATILYRYVDGVLTTTPLWDPTTGAFPHGEATTDGFNRVAGKSLNDVHTRLNVNTGGCAFPSGYASGGGGGGPANPATHATGVGTTSANAALTIQAGDDGLLVGVAAFRGVVGVGTINTPVSSCGSQSITALSGGESVSSPQHRRVQVFGITSPNSGACTISVTTSGSVDAVSLVAIRIPTMGSFGVPSIASNPPGGATPTPSVTASTNSGETVMDFVAGKCAYVSGACTTTWSVGPDQTWQSDAQAVAGDLRLIVSEQDGSDGGNMAHTAGTSHYWATVAVPIIPGAPDPPDTSTFRISNYRIYGLHGSQATPEVSLGPLAAQNVAAQIGATGQFRLRGEIIVENATSTETGIHPYCKKVGGSFAPVGNSFGSGFVRYYGAGAEPTIPASLTPTTQRFTGTFAAGFTSRDSSLPVTLPAMSANTRTEIDYQFAAGNGLVAGDVLECEIRRDDGSTLGVHTNPLLVNIVGPRASLGF